jgi:hypothetical protein
MNNPDKLWVGFDKFTFFSIVVMLLWIGYCIARIIHG